MSRLRFGLAAIACTKIAVGLATAIFAGVVLTDATSVLSIVKAGIVASFGGAAVWMLLGQRDDRAVSLAMSFLMIATVFADALVSPLAPFPHAYSAVRGLNAFQVDAFTSYYIWRFAATFPRSIDPAFRRNITVAQLVSFCVGAFLLIANVVGYWAQFSPTLANANRVLDLFSRHASLTVYWIPQFALSLAALVVLGVRVRSAGTEDRTTASLFGLGLAACGAPTLVWLLMYTLAQDFTDRVLPFRTAMWVIYPTLLATPFVTAYAIVVRQALNVRVVVRRALQYLLARYVLLSIVIAPVVLLIFTGYQNRNAQIAELAANPQTIALLCLSLIGLLALRGRHGLLDRLDRRFFRNEYDARTTLTTLVDGCRNAATAAELAHVLVREIDRALQLESAAVYLLDASRSSFSAPYGGRGKIHANSVLVRRLSEQGGWEYNPQRTVEELRPLLDDSERYWLVDNGARLLLPLRSPDREVVGILLLGEKKSELPFSAEDRMLLAAVTSAAELTLASQRFFQLAPTAGVARSNDGTDHAATECSECGKLGVTTALSESTRCDACGSAMQHAVLPSCIGDRFVVHARVGAGGMGVVYRGTDLSLGRAVALKTLPFLGPNEALRLRREARAMATVSHPNLAQIYTVESWHALPILVCEFVSGGTLAEKIANGPLSTRAAFRMGRTIAQVLAVIHSSGVLHRDIKPTNIGLTRDGEPKLLDFGLAKAFDAILSTASLTDSALPALMRNQLVNPDKSGNSSASFVMGTPTYMSPEALAGDPPSVQTDLWSLAVVIYEALTGAQPFLTNNGAADRRRIMTATLPEELDTMESSVNLFFRTALHRVPQNRFVDARSFAKAIDAIVTG